SWLQTAGWPFTLIPLAILYFYRRKTEGSNAKLYLITPRIFIASFVIGVVTGVDDFLYSWGGSKLPVSTSSLLLAAQLAFTAIGAFFIVKLKFTPYSINAVVLLTVGAVLLGVRSNGDRPEGVTSKAYILGFMMTLLAAALYGVILPCIELIYLKAKQAITATLVLEIQMVMCFAAISREAKQFNLGEARYYTVIVWTTIIWQCFFVGVIGVIYCSSSLMSGVMIAVLLPVTEVLAVVFFRENFSGEKGLALFLSLWGFISYFYGEFRQTKKQKNKSPKTEMTMIMLEKTDLVFNYRSRWDLKPQVIYIKNLNQVLQGYDVDMLSYIDICVEYTEVLRLREVKQILITGSSGRYYVVEGDEGIRKLIYVLSAKFNVVQLFAIHEGEEQVIVPNIIQYNEQNIVTLEVGTDCDSSDEEGARETDSSDYDREQLEVFWKEMTKEVTNKLEKYKEIEKGMSFKSLAEAKRVAEFYGVATSKSLKIKKSDTTRARYKYDIGYPFGCHLSKDRKDQGFKINT
uniref:Probable purine permease n=1 Tax=Nicotiana tabacum TaxID=4097 RepID=A0A1S4AAJ7_TOBAC